MFWSFPILLEQNSDSNLGWLILEFIDELIPVWKKSYVDQFQIATHIEVSLDLISSDPYHRLKGSISIYHFGNPCESVISISIKVELE